MKIFGTTVVKYAVVETDYFPIRVSRDGNLSRYDDELGWVWFDQEKFTDEEIAAVKYQGTKALELN